MEVTLAENYTLKRQWAESMQWEEKGEAGETGNSREVLGTSEGLLGAEKTWSECQWVSLQTKCFWKAGMMSARCKTLTAFLSAVRESPCLPDTWRLVFKWPNLRRMFALRHPVQTLHEMSETVLRNNRIIQSMHHMKPTIMICLCCLIKKGKKNVQKPLNPMWKKSDAFKLQLICSILAKSLKQGK